MMNMARAFILAFSLCLTGILLMGCSHDVSSERNYLLKGENDEWDVDYRITFTTTFPEENGKQYAKRSKSNLITVTFKKDLAELAEVKNMKISYKDSFGSGGYEEQNYDEPLEKTVFRLGGGKSSSKSELVGFLAKPENFYQAMTIYGSPAGDGADNAYATVTVESDDRIQQIQLQRVREIVHKIDFLEILKKQLSGIQVPSYYFSELNLVKPDLQLVKVNTRISAGWLTNSEEGSTEQAPEELFYEFMIKNAAKSQTGDFYRMGMVDLQMVPGDRLSSIMNQITGHPNNGVDGVSDAGFGIMTKGDFFNSEEECEIIFSYDLQPYETSSLNERIALSEEQKKELLDRALDAVLIIKYKGEPLAQFNLEDMEENDEEESTKD
ncbi:hypothetical protein FRZ06_03065 [Anoxybacterium hadale]|uniref:Uncharacterized protein n=1 Tax=Anoxybacterium hadale TaxID=3408580 RepID=A0ACD1A7R5_9FIRM|nr:hypothetical protein FRZ06_03065 [Clostridiales bacterium]